MSKQEEYLRKPEWLKIKLNTNKSYTGLKKLMREKSLNTVCEEARCPNIHECWSERQTATFMILGDTCTRGCRFCAVKTGLPSGLDLGEPKRVADSVKIMGLKHVVVTAVARDDLDDGGAAVFANTVRAIRNANPGCTIEVLPSDMKGDYESLHTLMDSKP
ncbi:lipoyl synthase, partial [Oceanobacillus caeni]